MDIDMMPAGREMDALIAKNIFEWTIVKTKRNNWFELQSGLWKPDDGATDFPHYSTDIAAAWQVIEKMRGEESGMRVYRIESMSYWQFGFRGAPWAEADTAPLAICRAALKTVGVTNVQG
jgi:hypothetical protein